MYISELTIKGFKSFAEPTKVKFDQGITCIVGPNGCGKTNVVDAIRWVLGEQKTSVLRSQSMHDVIFSGTTTRKPLSFAEVSLNIHNNRGVLPVEYTDVTIMRRVFGDGTSEYFLNKNACRLKDILNLFMDTGMGSDAYSVIELKMVESILSDSKDERRRLIDEAAGVNKYKQQRNLSFRRLQSTATDLLRITDILQEVEKNVDSLRRQLKRYNRYESVKQQLQEDEIALAVWNIHQRLDHMEPLQRQTADLQHQHGEQSETLSLTEHQAETMQAELTDLEQKQQGQREVVRNQEIVVNDLERKLLVAGEKIAAATAAMDRLKVEDHSLQERQESTQNVLADLENEREHLLPQIDEKQTQNDKLKAAFDGAVNAYREAQTTFDAHNRQRVGLLNAVSELKHQQERYAQSISQFEQNLKSLAEKQERLEGSEKNYQEDLFGASSEQAGAEQVYKELESRIQSMEGAFQETQSRLNETRETLAQQRGERVSVENQLGFYEELLETGEGYSSGVRSVLEAKEQLAGIIGTVADVITVDDRYQVAIQTGLGGLAEVIVTQDRQSAEAAIRFLETEQKGAATFFPLMEAKKKAGKQIALNGENVIGAATAFVKTLPGYESVVEVMLGELYLVEDGFTPDWKNFKGRIVTTTGKLIDYKGFIQGGHGSDEGNSIVGRRDRIEKLRQRHTQLVDTIEALSEKVEQFHNQLGQMERELRQFRSERENQRQIMLEFDRRVSRAQYGISTATADLKTLNLEHGQTHDRIKETTEKLTAVDPEIKAKQKELSSLDESVCQLEEQMQNLLMQRDAASEKLQSSRIEVVNLENERQNLDTRLRGLAENSAEFAQRLIHIAADRKANEETLHENRQIQGDSEKSLAAAREALRREQEIFANADQIYQNLRLEYNELEHKLRAIRQDRELTGGSLKDLELKLAEMKSAHQRVVDRIFEKYQIELPAHPEPVDIDPEEMGKRIERSLRFIENLGPINMAVKDEFESEQSRLNFLSEQQADLVDAKTSLLETISRLDRVARKQFRDTFEQVRENFKATFQMLFDGGAADIHLENADDLLESDLVITATPKGKKTQNLKMLSAGEKALTAIALLFAIYQVKPSPFCILDEVDAPLDDHNVRKFTKILDHFTTNTQFIVITHNKLTMEAARYLYGVTMEEEGVSKLVSVKFV